MGKEKKINSTTANAKGKGGQSKGAKIKLAIKMKKKSPPPPTKGKGKTTTTGNSSTSKPALIKGKLKKSNATTTLNKTQMTTTATTATNSNPKFNLFSKPANYSSISRSTNKVNINNSNNSNHGGNANVRQKQQDNEIAKSTTSDKSLLNTSHDVRLHGFSSISTAVDKSTPKVKHLLLNECDLILECRVCKNLFRSLHNFISHKLLHCKSLFHPTTENGCSQFIPTSSVSSPELNLQYYIAAEPLQNLSATVDDDDQQSSSEMNNTDNNVSAEEQNPGELENNNNMEEEIRSTATTTNNSTTSLYENIQEFNEGIQLSENVKIELNPVNGRKDSIMFQKLMTDKSVCGSSNDNREVVDRDTAILGPDGKVICTGTARGIEKIMRHLNAQIDLAQRKMVQQSTNQFPEMCDICKTVFNTEKGLRQHRRDAPDCAKQSLFKTSVEPDTASSTLTTNIINGGVVPEEKKQFVKQLFSKSPSASHLQRLSVVPSTSTNSTNPPKQISPYKKTVGKAVKNLQTSSFTSKYKIPNSTTTTNHLKFPCTKCSIVCSSTHELYYHLVNQCPGRKDNAELGRPAAKIPRIGIEVRSCYNKKPLDLAEQDNDTKFTTTTTNEQSNTGTSNNVPNNADDDTTLSNSKMIYANNNHSPIVDVNYNMSLNDNMECDDEESVEMNYSPITNNNMDNSETNNVDDCNSEFNKESCSIHEIDLPIIPCLENDVECEQDQDAVSNLTDSSSGVSCGTGISGDDPFESRVRGETSSPSIIDSVNNSTSSEIYASDEMRPNKRKSNKIDDRVLAPKNKNLKSSSPTPSSNNSIEAAQILKRVSVRNLQKSKSSSSTVGQKTLISSSKKK